MVNIKPFRGILYNKEKIDDFANVVAPPYDVITPSEQEALYQLSDFNAIRLILGKDQAGDDEKNNKYTRAAATYHKWLQEGVLKKDTNPLIYVYQQEYELKTGKKTKRTGFISLVRLEPLERGLIRPHERTLSQPKEDRFNLLSATGASFCQIFSLYSDPKQQVDPILNEAARAQPELETIDSDGVFHRIWKIDQPQIIETIVEIMKDKTLYIADGHHRYETALRFQSKMRKLGPNYCGEESFDYTMMMLVDMDSQELTVLPIHRVLKNLKGSVIERLTENLKTYFDIETFEFNAGTEHNQRLKFLKLLQDKGEKKHVFGMYSGNSKYYLLTLKNEQILDKILKQKNTENWKKLDVAILHSLIIDYLLHVKSTDSEIQAHIQHVKDEDEAIALIDSKKYQLAFFLNPTKVDQVKDISSQGEVLPQKSTFFYPKLLSGLVMFALE